MAALGRVRRRAAAVTAGGLQTIALSADIALMPEADSPWRATVATNPAVVGEVSVRALAIMLTDGDPGAQVIVPPTLITQDFLNENNIRNMEDLFAAMPQLSHADVAMTDWMPLPPR